MISLEIGETMVELSLAALESAGDRMGGQVDRRGEGGAVQHTSTQGLLHADLINSKGNPLVTTT
jgi:hypothetical protein